MRRFVRKELTGKFVFQTPTLQKDVAATGIAWSNRKSPFEYLWYLDERLILHGSFSKHPPHRVTAQWYYKFWRTARKLLRSGNHRDINAASLSTTDNAASIEWPCYLFELLERISAGAWIAINKPGGWSCHLSLLTRLVDRLERKYVVYFSA